MDRELVNEVSEVSDLVKRLQDLAEKELDEIVSIRAAGMKWNSFLKIFNENAELRDRIERLEPYKDELEKIAEDLGEAEDPFAAWEAVEALKAELAAEKALADRLAVLLYSHSQGILGSDGDDQAIEAYRKARGL